MGGFVAEAPPLLLLLWHFFGPARQGYAVAAPVASRFISKSAQDARGDARRRKRENSPAARPRPWPGGREMISTNHHVVVATYGDQGCMG